VGRLGLTKITLPLKKVINHVHVYDLFEGFDDVDDNTFERLAQLLQFSWSLWVRQKYPQREVFVDLRIDQAEYGPTLLVYQS
jgi:hypothetical protein